MFYSPLRYPGGKNRLAKFIADTCNNNNIDGQFIELYAGGASVALHMLLEGKIENITINDYDRSIFAFWYSVVHNTKDLCKLIKEADINIETRLAMKAVQKNKSTTDLLSLGYSTLFLNRANRSGIIGAGVMGGNNQAGKYKITDRFKKDALIEKIQAIAKHRKNIKLHNKDGMHLLRKLDTPQADKIVFYLDPPYYKQGKTLYSNHYTHDEHAELAKQIKALKHAWITTYDAAPQIKEMWSWANTHAYTLKHHAYTAREGSELLFYSERLTLPQETLPI